MVIMLTVLDVLAVAIATAGRYIKATKLGVVTEGDAYHLSAFPNQSCVEEN